MIQDIIDELVTMQQAITPPAGEKDIAAAYDEHPAQVTVFPCFINDEDNIVPTQMANAHRHLVHTINMHLLFAAAGQRYSQRSRRKWVRPVLDAFGAKIQLNGTATQSRIAAVTFDPVTIGDAEYAAATFVLVADVDDNFQAVA